MTVLIQENRDAAVDAAIAFQAKASAQLVIIPLEDICGEIEQPNLPGTTTEYPNWRRRQKRCAKATLESRGAQLRLRTLAGRKI